VDLPLSGREMDAFEHILTSLFVLRANTIKSGLARVAPGAVNLLAAIKKGHPGLTELGQVDIDPDTIVYDLTNSELVALAKMFERWPFKPKAYYKLGPDETAEVDTIVE
jgi:transcription factor 1